MIRVHATTTRRETGSLLRTIFKAFSLIVVLFALFSPLQAQTVASKTLYPVVFVHGLNGNPLNFADSSGTPIENSSWVSPNQQTLRVTLNKAHDSEVRGEQLFNAVRNYMIAVGAKKVNLIGHSQGGLDIRKAAHRLKSVAINGSPAGESKVAVMISIQTPHRGTPIAQKVLNMYAIAQQVENASRAVCNSINVIPFVHVPCQIEINNIVNTFYNTIFNDQIAGQGNDIIKTLTQLAYEDFDPKDGVTTGARHFNNKYPSEPVAGYVGSVLTAQDSYNEDIFNGRSITVRALDTLLFGFGRTADGDLANCNTSKGFLSDCDSDGAAGNGNGKRNDLDDDGLVVISSMQMGHRLQYNKNDCAGANCSDPLDSFTQISNVPYVSNINLPPAAATSSRAGVLNQDHFDVINSSFSSSDGGFDELEFFAALINFVHSKESVASNSTPSVTPAPVKTAKVTKKVKKTKKKKAKKNKKKKAKKKSRWGWFRLF